MLKIEIMNNAIRPLAKSGNGIMMNLAAPYDLHISRYAREKYNFNKELFSTNGRIIFANFSAVRLFADKMNKHKQGDDAVKPGEINAIGLLEEIFHFILREYETKINPGVFKRAEDFLAANLAGDEFKKVLTEFAYLFPALPVYNGEIAVEDYLAQSSDGKTNREILIEEIILLHFSNINPAARKKFLELFSDEELAQRTAYRHFISGLEKFFVNEKPFGPDNQHIFDMLRTPIVNCPDSLEDQLKFIVKKWEVILSSKFLNRLLSGLDLIKEDVRFAFFGGGGAPTVVPKYKSRLDDADMLAIGKSSYKYGLDSHLLYDEPERFTQDIDWMSNVTILAKNVYVWLDQLSKKYRREITRLDQIPEEELDRIGRWNVTGLWLIGLWEKSRASQKIKNWMGNPDAAPSAYSLYDYEVAYDLGGEAAFQNLNERCKSRGIRLSSDMVPNHTGIYSKWIKEHPDYFVQAPYSPFPNYSFTGGDLSEDPSIQIRIEDGYWSKRDAAVVFQRIDNNTGEVRYIYHGNDGTNMPWNDTAQLNLLKPEVREALIQNIFHVARKTSIIRFDAAMTLTKKHYQRLWYPHPGTGGDIPSRADYAMTREEFDRQFPVEFWREVVDRINKELPNTLLLAEAFWLMEGYFVRSLGMHRVYNSAFMHMMLKEENAKYRDLITNTLEFNPEILKRYVNFMSNPDEETAIRQFGSDDKYFGVALLMVTFPGLPMFAHGQVEGYSEKYGMEYRRAYYNELPNDGLIRRHEEDIFPLLGKRYLFSHVHNFWFYDFKDGHGNINENVFAFSNRAGEERALILYNNKYEETSGWINWSTLKNVGGQLKSVSLGEALNINGSDKIYYIFTDHKSKLEYIRSGKEIYENGIFVSLQAFKYHAFIDFREVYDAAGEFEAMARELNGGGIYNLIQEAKDLKNRPLHQKLAALLDSRLVNNFTNTCITGSPTSENVKISLNEIINSYFEFSLEMKKHMNSKGDVYLATGEFDKGLNEARLYNQLFNIEEETEEIDPWIVQLKKAVKIDKSANYAKNDIIYLIWLALYEIGLLSDKKEPAPHSLELMERFNLSRSALNSLNRLGLGEYEAKRSFNLIRLLVKYNYTIFDSDGKKKTKTGLSEEETVLQEAYKKLQLIENIFADDDAHLFLGLNFYEGVWYFSKENFEELCDWLFTISILNYLRMSFDVYDVSDLDDKDLKLFVEKAKFSLNLSNLIKRLSAESEYKTDNLKEKISHLKERSFVKI
ncbi:MAG TPA: alpha-amylase family glycosyl hydrolase [Ignavibacteriales bacterium]|nr:alpha-amylase family glycosyl hydrolase [Ignavibacteriales bacterium]